MQSLQTIPFKDYKDGIFRRLAERSKIANLSEEERAEYNRDLKWTRDYNAEIRYVRNEGIAEGEAIGKAIGKAEVAGKMKAIGMDPGLISQLTGLTAEEINAL